MKLQETEKNITYCTVLSFNLNKLIFTKAILSLNIEHMKSILRAGIQSKPRTRASNAAP